VAHVSALDARERAQTKVELVVNLKAAKTLGVNDHAAGAAAASLPLRPTDLLILGNAKGGTPLMQAAQAIGIDLPLKALVWQNASATTWLSYNDQRGNDRERGRNHEPHRIINSDKVFGMHRQGGGDGLGCGGGDGYEATDLLFDGFRSEALPPALPRSSTARHTVDASDAEADANCSHALVESQALNSSHRC
jgi:uncharacterized protein (DUF302 family)